MKKWIVILLCMLMSFALPAMAEDVQYDWYDDPAGRYSFAYPATWTVVSRENIEATLDEAETVDDEAFVDLLKSVREQISMSDLVMLVADNMVSNINIMPQEVGMEMNDEVLLELGTQLQAQLQQQMPGIAFPLEPYLIDLETGESVLTVEYTYDIAGYELYGVQTMHTKGTTLYTITLTSDAENVQADAQVLGLMLGSLTVE